MSPREVADYSQSSSQKSQVFEHLGFYHCMSAGKVLLP